MSNPHGNGRQRTWVILSLAVLVAMGAGQAAKAGNLYARAAWTGSIRKGVHSVNATVTVVDDSTLQVEHFTYDGLGPLVSFYLGATNSSTDFQNGLQVGPLLDRAYADESLTLELPPGETLDGYGAISVWCVENVVSFGSASFTAPASLYARAGWMADLAPGQHLVAGQATIITDRIIDLQHFSYDGTAAMVFFHLGATDSDPDFQAGLQVPPVLNHVYADDHLVVLLPTGASLDGYGALAVWSEQLTADFGSGSFADPLSAVGDGPAGAAGFALHANVPNPFNPVTTVDFDLPASEQVELTVYDVAGRRVRRLLDETMPAGPHSVLWDGRDDHGARVASGTYLCHIRAGDYAATREMVLVK